MKVLVVTANDVDNCQRCLGIFARLLLRVPELHVDFVCSESALAKASRAIKIPSFLMQRLKFHFGIVDQSIGWHSTAESYHDGSLMKWINALNQQFNPNDYKAVFADNLAGVLSFRGDAILFGNYLWSDVLDQAFGSDPIVSEFVKFEKDLLKKYRPKLLCSSELVMPSMIHKTYAVRCGLLTDPFASPNPKNYSEDSEYKIAIFNSPEVTDDEITADMVSAMMKRSKHSFYIEQSCYDLISEKSERIHPIKGEHQDFAKVDAVIAPPKMYYLNECISLGIPLIMYYSPQHPEKTHFAARIRQAKLGYDLGSALGVVSALDAVRSMLQQRNLDEMMQSRQKINCNGFEESVTWIERYIL